jgi:hypothetical protein
MAEAPDGAHQDHARGQRSRTRGAVERDGLAETAVGPSAQANCWKAGTASDDEPRRVREPRSNNVLSVSSPTTWLERSTWLSNQLAELTQQASTAADGDPRRGIGPSKLRCLRRLRPSAPVEVSPVEAQALVERAPTLAIEADEETDRDTGAFWPFPPRRRGPDVDRRVRLISSQMQVLR